MASARVFGERVMDNWDRMVRATLLRENARHSGGLRPSSSGIAGLVPPSLTRSTNIDMILRAANEIRSDDRQNLYCWLPCSRSSSSLPSSPLLGLSLSAFFSRPVCEQAYSMAQNTDPSSDGQGFLQFKTGLMFVIKQKLDKREGGQTDRSRDIVHFWDFYQRFKRLHEVDDLQREEERWRESGTFSTNMAEYRPLFHVHFTVCAIFFVFPLCLDNLILRH